MNHLKNLIQESSIIGIGGARRCGCKESAAELLKFLSYIPKSKKVVVGCARGIDKVVRDVRGSNCKVFEADKQPHAIVAHRLVARSIACVSACATSNSSGLWVSFPIHACPASIAPSPDSRACFNGSGSGSWSSLAYAIGSGISAIAFLPQGFRPLSYWNMQPVDGALGWWQFQSGQIQLKLFQGDF